MSEKILAPMGGKIVAVSVKPDNKVQVDDEVLTMEAMKMEMPIASPYEGVVSEVLVSAGETVEAEQALLVID